MKLKQIGLIPILMSCGLVAEEVKQLWQPFYISERSGEQQVDLSADWELNYLDEATNDLTALPDDGWINVKQPTSVQWAHYQAGKLPNPYEHLNAEDYKWMEEKVWYYKKSFEVLELNNEDNALLVFDGIDYFSRIWLNGELLGYHEGMWSGPAIEVSEKLNQGESNEIVVEVISGNYGQWGEFDFKNPGKIIKPRSFARGSSHRPFFALGMWRGVRLEIAPKYHIERPYLVTQEIGDNYAKLHLETELFLGSHTLEHELNPWHETQISNYSRIELAPNNILVDEQIELKVEFFHEGNLKHTKTFEPYALEGRSWVEETFTLKNPKLWYPNGMGEPNLYQVTVSLLVDGESKDSITFDYGVRTIKQVRSAGPRTTDRWKNWQFVVNNEPLFVKGINWMPLDPLYNFDYDYYKWVLEAAKKGRIQMIRVWGGGAIETEEFYDLCNKYGIMVFQGFPKNNNETPDWPQDILAANTVQNIIRLRNHPSLAVWSGGNEFNPYAYGNATTLAVYERSVDDFDPSRMWVRTSPDHGSTHLYPDFDPVWYHKELDIIPFVAEAGIHSIPEAVSLREVVKAEEFEDLGAMYDQGFAENHPEFIYHFMEYSQGRVPRMLSRASHMGDMANPTLEEISIATQISAGEFYQTMSEGIQANYPVTTGLMPWVFKRPWPTVSAIHLLDGFGQPSAPFYFLKRTYAETRVMLGPIHSLWAPGESIPLDVLVIHGGKKQLKQLDLNISILDEAFNEIYSDQIPVKSVQSGPLVHDVGVDQSFEIPQFLADTYMFIILELKSSSGEIVSRATYWPRVLSDLDGQTPAEFRSTPQPWLTFKNGPWLKDIVAKSPTQIEAQITQSDNKDRYTYFDVTVSNDGDKPSFVTRVDVLGAKRLFVLDDNFFWLAPGEERKLSGKIKWREGTIPDAPQIQINAWNAEPVTLDLP